MVVAGSAAPSMLHGICEPEMEAAFFLYVSLSIRELVANGKLGTWEIGDEGSQLRSMARMAESPR